MGWWLWLIVGVYLTATWMLVRAVCKSAAGADRLSRHHRLEPERRRPAPGEELAPVRLRVRR